jgi:hypothetical protein
MSDDLWQILLVGACVVPMMIGGFSSSLAKAALAAAVVMCPVVLVAYAVLGHLGYLATQDESLEATIIRALSVMPGMMVIGALGYGVRLGFRRLLAGRSSAP